MPHPFYGQNPGCSASTRSLYGALNPVTLKLEWASDSFSHLTGLAIPSQQEQFQQYPSVAQSYPWQLISVDNGSFQSSISSEPVVDPFLSCLHEYDRQALKTLARHHQLYRLLHHINVPLPEWRLLDEPLMLTMNSSDCEPLYLQLWLHSDELHFSVGKSDNHEKLIQMLDLDDVDAKTYQLILNDPVRLSAIEAKINSLELYVSGHLLIEGIDITIQESIRRITQLLVDQNSVLHAEKFKQVDTLMCKLFRADTTAIVSFQRQKARLFIGDVSEDLNGAEYSFEELQGGQLMESITNQEVMTVPDLAAHCVTDLGDRLLALGVRSILLIPLIAEQVNCGHRTRHAVGLVGMLSNVPAFFDSVDRLRAVQLIPAFTSALTTALRQMHRQRFINNIHPSVEWRFIQEAERRSLGLLPKPIIFQNVFPLYGISDIRGSSQERNRAIQTDLLEQLNLGLTIVDAVANQNLNAFVAQLRLDLVDKIAEINRGVTVGSEVTISQYLHNRLENHFDYFSACNLQAQTAVDTYRKECHTKHGCLYKARAKYDFLLGQINTRLRRTWEYWQKKMQTVIPHYCDVEVTDGIDHMIYAGQAIAVEFTPFHLQSLRYEQLRAVCGCARTAFEIQEEFDSTLEVTHLVLVQDSTVDIFHDEDTEKLFDVRGTRDTRYEIVKKRIDKAIDTEHQRRITQPGMITVVFSTEQEEYEYREYLRYLGRERWVDAHIQIGTVEPLQGVSGLKFMRVNVLPESA